MKDPVRMQKRFHIEHPLAQKKRELDMLSSMVSRKP